MHPFITGYSVRLYENNHSTSEYINKKFQNPLAYNLLGHLYLKAVGKTITFNLT